jgi:hypothetical protein
MDIREGEFVTRWLAWTIPMSVRVTKITDNFIICGGDETDHTGYWFDRKHGLEIDEEIGWGSKFRFSGSYIDLKKPSTPEAEYGNTDPEGYKGGF